MGIHVTAINGMGASTISGSTITNTGMKAEDHMHISEDFIACPGVISQSDLLVTQNGTPNMSINVSSGVVYILNPAWTAVSLTETKFWRFKNDATVNVVIGANASGNPRITSIFAKITTGTTPDDDATNVGSLVAVDGTPAGSPTAPAAPSDGNGYTRLVNITVASGATSIVTANIADVRSRSILANVGSAEGSMSNGKISATVAGNNLTLALLTQDGNTPSASNFVSIRLNNNIYRITSALSVTKNAGTNWFGAGGTAFAAREIDYFVYLGYNATDGVTIGPARIPSATKYSDFSTTTTNEKYCAISTITNASANDSYCIIGRFAATLSAGAGYTWSVPTFTPINLIQRPIYETRTLVYLPTYGGGGSMTYTSTAVAYYKLIGSQCRASVSSTGTTGGSASAEITWTSPITPSFSNLENGSCNVGVGSFVTGNMFTNSGYFSCYRYDRGNHGIGANAYLNGSIIFEY